MIIVLAGLAGGVVIARLLAPEGRGQLLALSMWALLIASLSTLGLEEAVIQKAEGDLGRARALVRSLRASLVVQSAIGASATCAITFSLSAEFESFQRVVIVVALGSLPPLSVFIQMTMVPVRAAQDFGRWNVIRLTPALGYLVAIAGLALASELSVLTAVVGLLGANLLTVLVARLVVPAPDAAGAGGSDVDPAVMRRFGRLLIAANLPNMANQRLDQLVMGAVAAPAMLGIYSVAASVVSVIMLVGTSIEQILFPRFAAGSLSRKQIVRACVVSTAATSLLALGIGLIASPVISAIYGREFAAAAKPLWFLLPGAVALVAAAAFTAEAKGEGRVASLAAAQLVGAALTVVLVAPAILYAGMVGAAIVSTTAYLAVLCSLLVLRRRGGGERR